MQLHQLPGAVVRTSLAVARLPLTAVEMIAGGSRDGGAWPPSLAFESFQAVAKQMAGSLLRDDTLVEEGRIGQAKVAQLRKATEIEAVAAQRSSEADREYQQRRQQDEQRRSDIDRQATRQAREVARQEAQRRQQVKAEADRKANAARQAEEASKKVVASQERAARKARLESEQSALNSERAAIAAKSRATEIDKALHTTKAARKADRS